MTKINTIINGALLVLCFSLVLLSCKSEVESRYAKGKLTSYESIDSLGLSKPELDTLDIGYGLLPAYLDYQVVHQADTNLLVGLNAEQYSLDLIDLDHGNTVNRIIFEQDGSNGIKGNIDGFYYHNPDTIFLLTIDENSIYLMNSDSKVQDVFRFTNVPLPDGFRNYDAYADMGIQNGPYYVASEKTLQFYTYRWVDNDVAFDYQTFASYSIVDRKFVATYGDYPDNYTNGSNFLIYDDPGLLVLDTLSYVYFGGAPEVFCYNNKSGELLFVNEETCEHWTGASTPLKSGPNDFQKEQDWLIEKAAYVSMEANEESGLIYRFLKHKQPVTNNGGLANGRWFGNWCITIHNHENLKQVGHYDLPKKTYYPPVSFATNEHLWIKSALSEKNETEAIYAKFQTVNEK